jgi:hypothetical protein
MTDADRKGCRGIAFGILIGLTFWAAVALVAWLVWR